MPKFVPKNPSILEPLEFNINGQDYSIRIPPKRLDAATKFSKEFNAAKEAAKTASAENADSVEASKLDELLPIGIATFMADSKEDIETIAEVLRDADVRELSEVYTWIWETINDKSTGKDVAGE